MYLFRQTLLFRLQLLFKLRSTFVSPSSFLFFLHPFTSTYFPPPLHLLLFRSLLTHRTKPPFFHVEIMQRRKRRWLSPRITLCLIFPSDYFFPLFFSSLLLFFFFFFFAFGIACVHFGLKVGRFLRLAPDKSEFPVVRVACDWEKTPCGLKWRENMASPLLFFPRGRGNFISFPFVLSLVLCQWCISFRDDVNFKKFFCLYVSKVGFFLGSFLFSLSHSFFFLVRETVEHVT